jgi:hypothetical protein
MTHWESDRFIIGSVLLLKGTTVMLRLVVGNISRTKSSWVRYDN